MREDTYQPDWQTVTEFLWSGHPPMLVRLLAVNALLLLLLAVRRAVSGQPMGNIMLFVTQFIFLTANLAVIFQRNIEIYIRTLMNQ